MIDPKPQKPEPAASVHRVVTSDAPSDLAPVGDAAASEAPADETATPGTASRPARPKPAQEDERGGPRWPEPTRYGDWERNGRCVDF